MAKNWYAVHTFSSWEKKIETRIRLLMQDESRLGKYCSDVKVPVKIVKEIKDGKERHRKVKILPGYILMELEIPEDEDEKKDLIYMVKSIEGVTGFVNATTARGSQLVPLSPSEVRNLFELTGEIKSSNTQNLFIAFDKGDRISIKEGSFQGFSGTVEEVQKDKNRLKVSVEIFGRPTMIDIDINEAEKL